MTIIPHVWLTDYLGNAIRVFGFIFHEGMPAIHGLIGL